MIVRDLSMFALKRHAHAILSAYPNGLVGITLIWQPRFDHTRFRGSGKMNVVYLRKDNNVGVYCTPLHTISNLTSNILLVVI